MRVNTHILTRPHRHTHAQPDIARRAWRKDVAAWAVALLIVSGKEVGGKEARDLVCVCVCVCVCARARMCVRACVLARARMCAGARTREKK